jgi:hypothetical protein
MSAHVAECPIPRGIVSGVFLHSGQVATISLAWHVRD